MFYLIYIKALYIDYRKYRTYQYKRIIDRLALKISLKALPNPFPHWKVKWVQVVTCSLCKLFFVVNMTGIWNIDHHKGIYM